MSARLSGRQSPAPEEQSAQQQEVPSLGKIAPEYKPDPNHARRESVKMRDTRLQSNPEHPLEQIEAEKMKK
ncbi:hypothetical protein PHISP_03629 [Aspergillus sp. HF37]|nr:hypothetical protein PHISP_03629 [Aspergillus sp. HF37]